MEFSSSSSTTTMMTTMGGSGDMKIPMMVLGGGGYTIENVSRCWAYESAMLAGIKLDGPIPAHEYSYYYQFEKNKLLFDVEKKRKLNT